MDCSQYDVPQNMRRMEENMKPWEDKIRRVVPYVPGEQPKGQGIIKLNTNENPYPPAPGVRKALEELRTEELRKYPDPTVKTLAGYQLFFL